MPPTHRLSVSQVQRALEQLRPHVSPLSLGRLDSLATLLTPPTHHVTALRVHEALFPGASPDNANKGLQRLRSDVADAAEQSGVAIELRVSEAKSVGAEKREVWFEGQPAPIAGVNRTEELERIGASLIEDAQGRPLGVVEPRVRLAETRDGKPVVRLFVSYAHADGALPHTLVDDLKTRLPGSAKYAFDLWQDLRLQPGENWDGAIRGALADCPIGLLLLTPAFFASEYIEVELAELVSGRGAGLAGKRIIPVLLKDVDFGNTDMRGLDVHQIFQGAPRKIRCFPKRESQARDEWVGALVSSIHSVLAAYADVEPAPEWKPLAAQRKGLRIAAQYMLSKDLEDADPYLINDAQARLARLDASVLDRPTHAESSRSVDAVSYVVEWLRDENTPALFALLGEYGMGKTITCQRVVRAVEEANGEAPDRLPMPLYFDLRRLTSLRGRDAVPSLGDILDECITRGWPLRGPKPTAAELLDQAAIRPMLFVFDGLDEALVHLSESHGREFTRELLRVRELAEGASFQTRVLLSCRTHYFRTIQEQDSHFTGHDRGRTSASDYAALVLLPLTEAQVRGYLSRALPDIDIDQATELVRSVHNLEELAARPYTLKLISEQIPRIEELRARGETVRGVTLYGLLVDKWLARDGGKHHIKPDHKRKLMRHLAAWTWSRGARHVAGAELEDWFNAWLEQDDAMRGRYAQVDRDKLEEDLRTATFLVREDDEAGQTLGFRFAHTSMQEYFLSWYLFDALSENRPERWSFTNVSDETWSFFAQHLGGGPERELLGRLREWALGERRETRWLFFRYVLAGRQRGWPAPLVAGIDLSGIDLQRTRLQGPIDLSGSRWNGATLRQVDFQDVSVSRAVFDGADLRFAVWNRVEAKGASFAGTRADGAVFRLVDFDGASGAGATGTRCSFIRSGVPAFLQDKAYIAPAPASWTSTGSHVEPDDLTPNCCAWSPDSTRIVAAGADGTVRLWDAASGVSMGFWEGHRAEVESCAWAPDGARVVSAGDDGTVRLWDAASGASLGVWEGHRDWVRSCAWAPDGTRIVSAGDDETVRLWDASSGASLGVWEGHRGVVHSCAWAPDGARIVSAGHDGTVRLWDAASGASLSVWESHRGSVRSCAWAPDGTRLASAGSDGTVRLWDAASGASLDVSEDHHGMVLSCAWSPDGTRVVSAGRDGTVRLWDTASGASLGVWEAHGDSVRWCAWAPDGTRIVSAGDHGTVRLWDASSGAGLGVWERHRGSVQACASSPDGNRLVSAGADGAVRLWDAASGASLAVWEGHRDWVRSCAWAPDSTRVVSASDDGTVRLWDAASGASLAVWEGHRDWVRSCAWAPDGTRIVSASDDRTVRLWDAASGANLGVWEGHTGYVMSCVWAPDGARVVSAGLDGTVRLWDAASGASLGVWGGQGGAVQSCAWSPDGTRVISADDHGALWLWDAASGANLGVWEGHAGSVQSCTWAPDGTRVVSAGVDGTVRLWDAVSGMSLGVWEGHRGCVQSCAWAPDGTRVVTAGDDGTVRVWDAASGANLIVAVVREDEHASYITGLNGNDDVIVEASDQAWRWLRWLVRGEHGTMDMLPAEAFGELPAPTRLLPQAKAS